MFSILGIMVNRFLFIITLTIIHTGIFITPQYLVGATPIQNTLQSSSERLYQEAETLYEAGDFKASIAKYNDTLSICRSEKNIVVEEKTLRSLAKAYRKIGDTGKLIECYLQRLPLIKNRAEETSSLSELGNIYTNTGEFQKALEVYERALKTSRRMHNKYSESYMISKISSIYEKLGDYQKAQDYKESEQSNKKVGDILWMAAVKNNKSTCHQGFLDDNDKNMKSYLEMLTNVRSEGNKEEEANILNNLGNIYLKRGDHQKSLDHYCQAIDIYSKLNLSTSKGFSLINTGVVYKALNNREMAIDRFTQAFSLSKSIKDQSLEVRALNAIGDFHKSIGDKPKALDHYSQALRLEKDLKSKAILLDQIADLYKDLDKTREALGCLNQQLEIIRTLKDTDGEIPILEKIGKFYIVANEYQKAVNSYNQALQIAKNKEDKLTQASLLGLIGNAYSKINSHKEALEVYNQESKIWNEIGNKLNEVASLSKIAKLYMSKGDDQKAIITLHQVLEIRRAINDRQGEAQTLLNLAQAHRNLKQLNDASSNIEQALQLVESVRSRIVDENLRLSYFESVQSFYHFYIDLLMQMHREDPIKSYDKLALHVAEKARARSLIELLAEAKANIRQGVPSELIEEEDRLQYRFNVKMEEQIKLLTDKTKATATTKINSNSYAEEGTSQPENNKKQLKYLSGKNNLDQLEAIEIELKRISEEYEKLQTRIRKASPQYAAMVYPEPVEVKDMQQYLLDKDSLLIEYFLGEESSYMWVVSSNSVNSYRLPKRSEIESLARLLYSSLTARSKFYASGGQWNKSVSKADEEIEKLSARMSDILLGPIVNQLGKKRLLIVADGALHYIPFAALPKMKDGTPVIMDHEVINLPSASTLLTLRRLQNDDHSKELTLASISYSSDGSSPHGLDKKSFHKKVRILADPVFNKDDVRIKKVISQKISGKEGEREFLTQVESENRLMSMLGEVNFSRLSYTRKLAKSIMDITAVGEGEAYLDFEASKNKVLNGNLDPANVVIFATHGILNSKQPELSGIILSLVNDKGEAQNGFLQLRDIYNTKLKAKLLILGACETALGKEIKGEGVIGLTRGFMYAGASGVMASLWKVDEIATVELIKRVYQYREQDGLSSSEALRKAQLSMLSHKKWKNPFFWSGFILQGEWK
jgi:CHAT domain-containing protein/tetratricopeptide (TPR) repeat protein